MKIVLYFYTIRYIKPIQLWYQVYYRLRKKLRKDTIRVPSDIQGHDLAWNVFIPSYTSYIGKNTFKFLNTEHSFKEIDWNHAQYGKLWTYNLNYFEFLNQQKIDQKEGIYLIRDFISKSSTHKDGYEPYPISLRIINWVKFISKVELQDADIDRQLYSDCLRLTQNIEYHLLANHYMENGFGLLFGAVYFEDKAFYRKALKILKSELEEQVLNDGAHYELSPMYHQIILYRILDCINLLRSSRWEPTDKSLLIQLLEDKGRKMLSWLDNMTFRDGNIPHVNDATDHIAPSTEELVRYAGRLGMEVLSIPLSDSGYRMYGNENFELLCDAGQIAPSYQPGHSHADNLNFLVHISGQPVIVDTGISTYEKNERRQTERSTAAHNTLLIDDRNSSQVWSGFRVGQRGVTTILSESNVALMAMHNGYRNLGVQHKRSFELMKEQIEIVDEITGWNNNYNIKGHLHFHPDCDVRIESSSNSVIVNDNIEVSLTGCLQPELEVYDFAEGFNKRKKAFRLTYILQKSLSTISIKLKA